MPSDVELLTVAAQEVREAERRLDATRNTLAFVQSHIARKYQLREGDVVKGDGMVERVPAG